MALIIRQGTVSFITSLWHKWLSRCFFKLILASQDPSAPRGCSSIDTRSSSPSTDLQQKFHVEICLSSLEERDCSLLCVRTNKPNIASLAVEVCQSSVKCH